MAETLTAVEAELARLGAENARLLRLLKLKYKTARHFTVTITDDSLTMERRQDQISTEAALDGFYVLRAPVPASDLNAPGVVAACKNLKYVSGTSGRSNPMTWTCARCSTGWKNASKRTC